MIPVEVLNSWLSKNNLTAALDVNRGECENFAQDVLHLFPDGEIVGTDNFVELFGKDWPGSHIWIMSNARHFDSEALEGVDDWRNLPFFKRKQEKRPHA